MKINHKLILGLINLGRNKTNPCKLIETIQFATNNGFKKIEYINSIQKNNQDSLLGMALETLSPQVRDSLEISARVGQISTDKEYQFGIKSADEYKYNYRASGILKAFEQRIKSTNCYKLNKLCLENLDLSTLGNDYTTHYKNFVNEGRFVLEELKKHNIIDKIGVVTGDIQAFNNFLFNNILNFDEITLTNGYNLADTSALREVLICERYHMPLLMSYHHEEVNSQNSNKFFQSHKSDPKKIIKIKEICDKYDISLRHAAMQFLHLQDCIKGIIVHAKTPDELKASLRLASQPIDPCFWLELAEKELIPEQTLSLGLMNVRGYSKAM